MHVHTVKVLSYLCGFTSYVSVKEGRTSDSRYKMVMWGGLEGLLYITWYSKVSAVIEFCKRINFKDHLSKSEITFIIDTIKKGTSGAVNEENKSDEVSEDTISFSKYFILIM